MRMNLVSDKLNVSISKPAWIPPNKLDNIILFPDLVIENENSGKSVGITNLLTFLIYNYLINLIGNLLTLHKILNFNINYVF